MAEEIKVDRSAKASKSKRVLVEVNNVVKYFPVRAGLLQRVKAWVKAVDDVSFFIYEGETFGLVGESGCGKTTIGRTILRLIPATSGSVIFDGQDLFDLNASQLKKMRRNIQIIFQDPYSSLDPRMPIGESIAEGLRIHSDKNSQERYDIVVEMLTRVGMRADHARRYPHEFSGGQRQRIGIARALALRPKFIVCDEPVSALDVSIQAQVLNILRELQKDFGLTYLFIAHNLSVVDYLCDRIGVMYLGHLMELGPAHQVYDTPLHPYSQSLINAVPKTDPRHRHQHRILLEGDLPSPINPPTGCVFHTRCPHTQDNCKTEDPQLRVPDHHGPNRWVACPHAEAIQQSLKKGP